MAINSQQIHQVSVRGYRNGIYLLDFQVSSKCAVKENVNTRNCFFSFR